MNPGARQPSPSKIIMRQSVQQDLKLKTTENARKPDTKTESLPAKPISQETKNNWVSRGPEQGPITIVHKEAKIKEKEEPRKLRLKWTRRSSRAPGLKSHW
ncbi:unnamed protein product [Pleuronectes platessa]|uniref:Uncharacterized protein n=1 Tax=Pleuronectes platessa TaxID=8262 RepID=A0A9N7VQL3_PLEPL|nr:unnamed protein product [Pleuronectes platessa]